MSFSPKMSERRNWRPPVCAKCLQNYVYKTYHKDNKWLQLRLPYLLKCGHSVCGDCIRRFSKGHGFMSCPICGCQSTVSDSEDVLSDMAVDYYTLSRFLNHGIADNTADNCAMKFVPAGARLPPSSKKKRTPKALCGECMSTRDVVKCHPCSFVYCKQCFDKTHKLKALSNHVSTPFQSGSFVSSGCNIPTSCVDHSRPIEYICDECDTYVCADCVIIGDHQGHKAKRTGLKNREYIGEVKNMIPSVKKVVHHLKRAEKSLCKESPNFSESSKKALTAISNTFLQLHGALQVRENELIAQVQNLFSADGSAPERMRCEVSEQLDLINHLLNDAEMALANPDENFSMVSLLKKMGEVCDQPCHLITLEEPQKQACDITFEYDENMAGKLRCFGKIKGEVNSSYKLVTFNEVPEECLSDILDDESLRSGGNTDSDSVSDLSMRNLSPENVAITSSKKKNRRITTFLHEMVFLTHVVNPSYFVVQRCSAVDEIVKLNNSINTWCRLDVQAEDTNFMKGDLVVAMYDIDKTWYRGRILAVIGDAEEKTKQETEDESVVNEKRFFEVEYLDFGNVEIVPLSSLRKCPQQFLNLPEQALKCCLHGIVPNNKDEKWDFEATCLLQKFTGNKPINLLVVETIGNMFHVDLRKPPLQEIISKDMPVSFRDTLVFLELGCLTGPKENDKVPKVSVLLQSYFDCELPPTGTTDEVLVSYVNDPHEFYIQKMDQNGLALNSMMPKLKTTYSGDTDSLKIYCPIIGMPCACLFSTDNNWYRARVEGLPGSSMVEVRFVDYGNTDVVSWDNIRKIGDSFMTLPIQAISCKLADVEPLSQKGWTREVSEVFKGLVSDGKLLKMDVKAASREKLSVVLYEVQEDMNRDICINAFLVSNDLARSTGPNSLFIEHHHTSSVAVQNQRMALLPTSPASTAVSVIPFTAQTKALLPTLSLPQISELITGLNKKIEEHIAEKVILVHTVSPSSIYVRFLNCVTKFERFMRRLKSIYGTRSPSKRVWNEDSVGETCVARRTKDDCWYRVKILKVNAGTRKAKVNMTDYGFEEEVDFAELQPWNADNNEDPPFVWRCHLADIKPAGGKDTWASMVIDDFLEYVSEIQKTHNHFYLIKKGKENEDGFPVDIKYEQTTPGGALEPSKTKFFSLSDHLLERGYALPRRIESKTKGPKQEQSSSENSGISTGDEFEEVSATSTPADTASSSAASSSHNLVQAGTLLCDSSSDDDNSSITKVHVPSVVRLATESVLLAETELISNNKAVETDAKNKIVHILKRSSEPAISEHLATATFDLPRLSFRRGKETPAPVVTDASVLDLGVIPKTISSRKKGKKPKSSPDRQLSNVLISRNSSNESLQAEEESPVSTMSFRWESPVLPTAVEFQAIPTYVDYECNVYLYEEENAQKLDLISASLQAKFGGSKPTEKDLYWFPGDCCIAKYYLDNQWYRAIVLQVLEDKIEIQFIDYGTTDKVDVSELRKTLIMTRYPQQSLYCHLHGIEPIDGVWHREELDLVHKVIVEKKASVIVMETPVPGKPLEICLRVGEAKIDELLMDGEFARKVATSDRKYNFYNMYGDSFPYKMPYVPDVEENFFVTISHVAGRDVYIQHFPCDTDPCHTADYENKLKMIEGFISMGDALNELSEDLSQIDDPAENDAVCCKYSLDDTWYRGVIKKILGPDRFNVLFVDYGNEEVASKAKIRKLPEVFKELPMHAIQCQLHQVVASNGQWSKVHDVELKKCLLVPEKKFRAHIRVIDHKSPAKIDIYEANTDVLILAYQNLIDRGLIQLALSC